jgi:NADH:ubiquinone oxidoreductase subunit H
MSFFYIVGVMGAVCAWLCLWCCVALGYLFWMETMIPHWLRGRRLDRPRLRTLPLIQRGVATVIKWLQKQRQPATTEMAFAADWQPTLFFLLGLLGLGLFPLGPAITTGPPPLSTPFWTGSTTLLALPLLFGAGAILRLLLPLSLHPDYAKQRIYAQSYGLFWLAIFCLSLCSTGIIYQSTDLALVVMRQTTLPGKWGCWTNPLAAFTSGVALLVLIEQSPFAETNQSNHPSCFHLWPAGPDFLLLRLGENLFLLAAAATWVTLFWGGWQIPFLSPEWLYHRVSVWLPMCTGLLGVALLWRGRLHYRLSEWRDQKTGWLAQKGPITALLGACLLLVAITVLPRLSYTHDVRLWLRLGLYSLIFLTKIGVVLAFVLMLRWTTIRPLNDHWQQLTWRWGLPIGCLQLGLAFWWAPYWMN